MNGFRIRRSCFLLGSIAYLDGDVQVTNRVGIELDGVGLTVFTLYSHSALTGAKDNEQEESREERKDCLVHIVQLLHEISYVNRKGKTFFKERQSQIAENTDKRRFLFA